MATLKERNVAILAVDGFEQVEMTGPRDSLQAAGARTVLISAKTDPILGMHHDKPGDRFPVDMTFFTSRVGTGGVRRAIAAGRRGECRRNPHAAQGSGIRARDVQGGQARGGHLHGAWLLISSGVVQNRTLTSWPSLRDDLVNAGAQCR